MFIRNSPLLDVLHRDFLYRAPWHGPLLAHPRFKRKEQQPKQTEFPPGVLRAIKPGWESLHGVVTLSFAWLGCVKSPRRQQTRGFPISLRQISCPIFARSDPGRSLIISPFFRPTKLPAYPGSPTPGARYGPALQRRRRPQARPSCGSLHLKLKNATSHPFTASDSHRCNSSCCDLEKP